MADVYADGSSHYCTVVQPHYSTVVGTVVMASIVCIRILSEYYILGGNMIDVHVYIILYSSPSIERPLPPETTSSYRPEVACTDALTIHIRPPLVADHLFRETKLC